MLLEVQPALSFNQIKHVSKLGKNYRVTRDVLNVSNVRVLYCTIVLLSSCFSADIITISLDSITSFNIFSGDHFIFLNYCLGTA